MPLLSQFSKMSNAYQMVIGRVDVLEMKYNDLEKKNESLHQENVKLQKIVEDLTVKLETKETENSKTMDYIKKVEEKTLEVECTLNILSVHHSELELQLQASLASTHNGAFLWCIPEMRRRIHDAKIGRITSIYSPPFYTGRNGYKTCIRVYLNGDGSGEGTMTSFNLLCYNEK